MKKFFELLFIIPIKIYQKTFSRVLPSTCRFTQVAQAMQLRQ